MVVPTRTLMIAHGLFLYVDQGQPSRSWSDLYWSLVYILHSPGLMCISPSLYITSGQDCSKNDTLAICFAISCKCHIVNGSIYYLQDYS